jgi:hypothetical protein
MLSLPMHINLPNQCTVLGHVSLRLLLLPCRSIE